MASIPKFDDNSLQAICDVLGDTASGLVGSEMGRLLARSGIQDVEPTITKRHRLHSALSNRQRKDNCANNVVAFIQNAMDPIRYTNEHEAFEARREALNVALSFRGYEVGQDGKVRPVAKVETLTEAEKRARALRQNLVARKVHPDVLLFCKAELLQDNYFHAVFEATKSVADKIRDMSGLSSDGAELVNEAFSISRPLLALSKLSTKTEKSEQRGFANLLKGIFGTFRNVTAHAPKIKWPIEEQDAMDLLTMASYAHRKLDAAVKTGLAPKN